MNRLVRPMLLLIVIVAALAGCDARHASSVTTLPFYADADLTPRWAGEDGGDPAAEHRVGAFSLLDQNGKRFTEKEMDGKISVVDFFFTSCPSLCPRLAKSMARIRDSVAGAADVILLSGSVTPEIDSVPVLARYAAHVGAVAGKWYLLTGDHRTIYDMARSSYFAKVDTGENAFLHTETFFLVDRARRIRGVYNGTLPHDVTRLIEDLKRLEGEERTE